MMEYIENMAGLRLMDTAVSLGKFDGVHIGHRLLISYMLSLKEQGLRTVVFSFSVNPDSLLSGRPNRVIYTEEEKRACLEELGVDAFISYPFTPQTARMEPEVFAGQVLAKGLGAKVITCGRDFRFGHGRRGSAALLEHLAGPLGFRVKTFDKVCLDGIQVSSSAVRERLAAGDMDTANRMLGRPYFINGEVLHGNEIGRTLGMPTVNLCPPPEKLLPPNGVYLSRVSFDGREYRGITNIGYKPTVGGETKKGVETYLYDFTGDLYGKAVTVSLFRFIRGEQKFASLAALKEQMHRDMEYGKQGEEHLPDLLQRKE